MLSEQKLSIYEDNVVSLRTVYFFDDGVLGSLVLLPPDPDCRPDGHLHSDVCWVYKRHRSLIDRMKGCYEKHKSASILQQLKPLKIRINPQISFLWSDSGHSVAVVVDGEPMGFIVEDKFCGYSKAIETPGIGNTWDEELFRKTFKV
jgi:hypothetical protein